jgi:hypothetical protein
MELYRRRRLAAGPTAFRALAIDRAVAAESSGIGKR